MIRPSEIEYKRVNQIRAGYERKYKYLFDALLMKQFRDVAAKVTADNLTPDVSTIVKQDDTQKLFVNLYQVVGVDFARQTYKTRKAETDLVDSWEQYMKRYAATQAGARIVSITKVTKEQLQRIMKAVIEQAVEDGLGSAETARILKRAITAQGEQINTWRALRIARTEVMTASNQGSLKGAMDLGVPTNKIWVATIDDRTRDSHIEMANTEIDIMEDFVLPSGAKMNGPGDPSVGDKYPEEVINCRCALTYRVRRER